MDFISPRARQNLEQAGHGPWLEQAPSLIEQLSAQWKLTQLARLDGGVGGVTLRGMRRGHPVVLKLCHPTEATAQTLGMSRIAGYGGPPILEVDVAQGALLLPWLDGTPGAKPSLAWISSLVGGWRQLDVQGLPPLTELATHRVTAAAALSLPPALQVVIEQAVYVTQTLLAQPGSPQLLHTDLGPHNLMSSADGRTLVLDCSAAAGEAAYDLGHWVVLSEARGPSHTLKLARRLADLSGVPLERIAGWGFQRGASSACFAYGRGETSLSATFMVRARALRELL